MKKQALAALLSGALFSLGLGLSGMTQPDKVMGFLDFTGAWEPALLFVMGGAVMVYFATFRLIARRKAPLFAPQFLIPSRQDVTGRLLAGAGLFGIGWGLAGFCPGPAIVSAGTGSTDVLLFLVSMIGGMLLYRAFDKATQKQDAPAPAEHSPSENAPTPS